MGILASPVNSVFSLSLSGVHLEFHSTFCLSLRLRKPGLMCVEAQGLPLWKSHWKMTKLVTEMVKMSWLNGSMATRPCCGQTEKERKKERQTDKLCFNFMELRKSVPSLSLPLVVSVLPQHRLCSFP